MKHCAFCTYPLDSLGHRVTCEGFVPPPADSSLDSVRAHLVAARDEVFDAGVDLRHLGSFESRADLIRIADEIRDLGAKLVLDTANLRDVIKNGKTGNGKSGPQPNLYRRRSALWKKKEDSS